jgi:hypothetical protein
LGRVPCCWAAVLRSIENNVPGWLAYAAWALAPNCFRVVTAVIEMIKKRASTCTVKFARTAHIDLDRMYTMPEAAKFLALLNKGAYRTVRIQGEVLVRSMNLLEKSLKGWLASHKFAQNCKATDTGWLLLQLNVWSDLCVRCGNLESLGSLGRLEPFRINTVVCLQQRH